MTKRFAPHAQVDHWEKWTNAGALDVLKYLPPLTEEEVVHYKSLRPQTSPHLDLSPSSR